MSSTVSLERTLFVPTSLSIAIAVAASLVICFIFLAPGVKFSLNAPPLASRRVPVLGSIGFLYKRWDFFRQSMSESRSGNFSFYLGNHSIVGLTGDIGRRVFFESKTLDFTEGYVILFPTSPSLRSKGGDAKKRQDFAVYFARRLVRIVSKENLERTLPKLIDDTKSGLQALANDPSGITDPFESIYGIVYQLTMRMVGCDDIAEDLPLLWKTLALYKTVEESATAASVMFPWLPTPAKLTRTIAGSRLYFILNGIVEARKKSGRRRDDPLQYLIDEGDDMTRIIEFVIGALLAGLVNSGVNSAWILVYLAANPKWMEKARKEITEVAAKYSIDSGASLVDQLTSLPLDAWENELPFVELCTRETIRLQLPGAALRKNISGRDVKVGDEIIPNNTFVAFAIADTHLDPSIYPEPEKWDPSRYFPERAEDKKKPLAYLGWGAGRHPCLGMRFAKLELKITTALSIAMFDWELSDSKGGHIAEAPPAHLNAHSASGPERQIHMKYRAREISSM